MARSARELFEEAMRLDPEERATLMRLLIETLDAESEEGVEDAWRVEIERRMAELDSGAVEAVPWEEIRARLYRRWCGRFRKRCSSRAPAWGKDRCRR
jgi:putative addiction module component (TIGR02574 family)